jgi:hypothetical protein
MFMKAIVASVFAFAFCHASITIAQPLGTVLQSFDSMVADAEQIMIGEITKLEPAKTKDSFVLQLKIEEMLKGRFEDSISVLIRSSAFSNNQELASQRILVFDDIDAQPHVFELSSKSDFELIDSQFNLITTQKELIENIRELVPYYPAGGRVEVMQVIIPSSKLEKSKKDYSQYHSVNLNIPIGQLLRERSEKTLTTLMPARILQSRLSSEGDDELYSTMSIALRGISYFKTPENIKLVRSIYPKLGGALKQQADRTLEYWNLGAEED